MAANNNVVNQAELDLANAAAPDLDIDVTELDSGEIEVAIDEDVLSPPEEMPLSIEHNANLAEHIDESTLDSLASELADRTDHDEQTRGEWDSRVQDGIDLLGFKIEELSEPFEGACGAYHPLLAQAVVRFQAKAFKELYPSEGPVRTKVIGVHTPEREDQAKRVREYMNYQTTTEMTEYGPDLDRLLFYLGLFGTAFKKTYYDHNLGRPVSRFVKAENFAIDYYATDLYTADHYAEKYFISQNELKRLQISKIFRDVELSPGNTPEIDSVSEASDDIHGQTQPTFGAAAPFCLYEYHCNLDLPGFEHPEGLLLPYIVIVERESSKILSIRRNWNENDPDFRKRVYYTRYILIPGLGFYGYGYLHLIGGLAKTATSTLRQLIDAGTFANLPAGFKAYGLRVMSPDEPIAPGEWREVNAAIGDISKSLLPLPYKEPSSTLMQLLTFVVAAGQDFVDATDKIVEEASNYGPVGTTMALLEQSSKLFSAIHKRLHDSQSHDLRLLADINREWLPNQYPYEQGGVPKQIFRDDFDLRSIDVIPVSDPNMPTEAHRIAKINAVMSIAVQDPAAHNMNAIRLDLYRALGVTAPERYLAQGQQPSSGDPITENSLAIMGTPLVAKPEQNHDAHVTVHTSMLGNPAYQQHLGMRQILMSHVNDHLAWKYRLEILQLINNPQITQAVFSGQPLPPEIESQVAIAAAAASDTLTKVDEAKARILAGQDPDPVVELQRKELALRERQQQAQEALDAANMALKEAGLMIDDANKDADRDSRERIARMQSSAKRNTAPVRKD